MYVYLDMYLVGMLPFLYYYMHLVHTFVNVSRWIYLCLYVLPVRRHEKFYCAETDFQRSISLQQLIHP